MPSTHHSHGYLPWITCITITYLIFELSFNARLLDVIGCAASSDSIKHVENWGRILSGMAVTILIWGVFIMPRTSLPISVRFLLMIISGILCISAIYDLEKKLVTHLVDLSTGQQRKEAVTINFVTQGIQKGSIDLTGFPLHAGIRASPSDKQVMAILPFYILSIDNIDFKITEGVLAAIHNTLVDKGLNAQELFDNSYKPFTNHMHDVFRQYAALEQKHLQNPSEDMSAYRQHLNDIFGYLPNHIYEHFSDFFMSPGIQNKARKALDIESATAVTIPSNLNPFSFRFLLWPQIIHYKTHDTYEQKINHPASDYNDGGLQSNNGREAMEAIIAPPIALFFSVIGAFTHIFKSLNYLLLWRKPTLRFRKTLLISSLGLIAFGVEQSHNTLVSMPLYKMMATSVSSYYPHGTAVSSVITWLIKMQSVFYPINETIRRTLLLGLHFGA